MIERLLTSKTAWAALVGIVTAIGAGMTGDLAWPEAAKLIFAGVLVIFFRDGIAGRGPGKYPS